MNKLEHIKEFEQALKDYHLPDEAKETLRQTQLVLLIGPSSSGRNTIINELMKSGKYHYVISDTTREPRANNGILEQTGREYWFRTEDQMLEDIKNGKFLEAAVIHNQQVSGISMRELEAAAKEHRVAIDEIEVVGADNIHKAAPETIFLFILPPSFDEWMARMSARGKLPLEETRRRLNSAVSEITTALNRDYYKFIVNDTFIKTAARIDDIIAGKLSSLDDQAEARSIAKQLIVDTQNYLDSEC
jgi:guanylate kinase